MLGRLTITLKHINWHERGFKKMSKGSSYYHTLKRRRKNKTDYRKRKLMVLSKIPRVVIRGSLKNMLVQVIEAFPEGDKTRIIAHSRELREYGWKAPCGNLPASYLTGLVLGLKATSIGIKRVIPDIGLKRSSPGSRVFAVVKGIMDSGLKSPCGDILPEESRINGQHIASYTKELFDTDPELYKIRFSKYLSNKLKPEQLPMHFNEVKSKIIQVFQKEGSNV